MRGLGRWWTGRLKHQQHWSRRLADAVGEQSGASVIAPAGPKVPTKLTKRWLRGSRQAQSLRESPLFLTWSAAMQRYRQSTVEELTKDCGLTSFVWSAKAYATGDRSCQRHAVSVRSRWSRLLGGLIGGAVAPAQTRLSDSISLLPCRLQPNLLSSFFLNTGQEEEAV